MNWVEFLQKGLSESPDEPSSMRIKTFIIVAIFTLVVAFGYLWTVIFYKDLIIAQLGIIAGLIGTALYFKNRQKEKEE